jgi:hypothetical protein
VSHDIPQDAPEDSAAQDSTPAMPKVQSSELFSAPVMLVGYGNARNSLGWQDHRNEGPSFVLARTGSRVKVTERFPLTEQGWSDAWQALVRCDPSAAEAIVPVLTKREAQSRAERELAALDAESLYLLRYVTFNGGSGATPFTQGQFCELRFLKDKVIVCRPRSPEAILHLPYRDVETVEVTGSASSRSASEQVVVVLVLGLLGALLGLLFLGLTGFFLGGLIFALIGAVASSAWSKIETTVRLKAREGEYYFLNTEKRPEALRIEMSESLRAIDKARAAQPGNPVESTDPALESIPDQLSRLGSLLQQGLITTEEFEHLKARLLAQPQDG